MARDPKAVVEVTAESKSLGARLREARAKFSKFGGELKKEVFGKNLVEGGFLGKAGAQMVGNLGANAMSAVSGLVVSQGRDVLEFNDALKRLEITAGKTPEEMAAFASSIRKTSSEVGIGAKEILDGAAAYVALTGDMDGAARSANTWARVAQATNSTVADISQTAAALKQNMAINPEDMEKTFSGLAAQGKAGAIELKDLAAQLSSIAPQWAEFAGGKGVNGVKQLGAALQIVKRGFGGDAGETVTGLQSLLNAYVKNAARLKKGGVKIFETDPKTGIKHLRNVLDITKDLASSKLAKDPTKLEKALGRVEAYRAYLQLKDNTAELQHMIEVAEDGGMIQRDLDKYTQSSAGRTKVAWQKAKNEIAEAFTPERIEAFTSAMIAATRVAASLASTVAGVVGGIERAAVAFAQFLGGKTEEDRATEAQADWRNERVGTVYDRLDATTPQVGGGEEGRQRAARLMALASQEIDAEDAAQAGLGSRLRSGKPTIGDSLTGGGFPGAFGPTAGTGGGAYSMEELMGMRTEQMLGGATNAKGGVNLIDDMIAKLVASQNDMMSKIARSQAEFLQRFGTPTFKIGEDPIMTVVRGAPQNARRPGD